MADADSATRARLSSDFQRVRRASIEMCAPLSAEDFRIQPIAEVSPPWWNLGHTSWFFARNVLQPMGGDYTEEDQRLDYALNSYYASLGMRIARDRRGSLSRPRTAEIYAYRESVDRRVERLIATIDAERLAQLASLATIGLQHEQQHQELFYTEIKYILAQNPLPFREAYRASVAEVAAERETAARFVDIGGGLLEFGNLEGGWCWDNELPVHKAYLDDFRLQDRLVTCGEYLEFVADGGYGRQLLWLDNGWSCAERLGWHAPLYWEQVDGRWMIWTLSGMQELDLAEPVCHVSFYEADALARWKSETYRGDGPVRLPTEREWEHAARQPAALGAAANLLGSGRLHPSPAPHGNGLRQMIGDVWEWTSSYYEPYPGFRPFAGALAEYNGKFMDNQRVLRGGSCVTPPGHLRPSYRNFWSADTRFQFTGIRLAECATRS
jgi:ergothioneine biosynthesis protein EgtB